MVERPRHAHTQHGRNLWGDPVPGEIGERIATPDVVRVARERAEVALSPYARERVIRSRAVVGRLMREGRMICRIMPGVREFAGVHISPASAH